MTSNDELHIRSRNHYKSGGWTHFPVGSYCWASFMGEVISKSYVPDENLTVIRIKAQSPDFWGKVRKFSIYCYCRGSTNTATRFALKKGEYVKVEGCLRHGNSQSIAVDVDILECMGLNWNYRGYTKLAENMSNTGNEDWYDEFCKRVSESGFQESRWGRKVLEVQTGEREGWGFQGKESGDSKGTESGEPPIQHD